MGHHHRQGCARASSNPRATLAEAAAALHGAPRVSCSSTRNIYRARSSTRTTPSERELILLSVGVAVERARM